MVIIARTRDDHHVARILMMSLCSFVWFHSFDSDVQIRGVYNDTNSLIEGITRSYSFGIDQEYNMTTVINKLPLVEGNTAHIACRYSRGVEQFRKRALSNYVWFINQLPGASVEQILKLLAITLPSVTAELQFYRDHIGKASMDVIQQDCQRTLIVRQYKQFCENNEIDGGVQDIIKAGATGVPFNVRNINLLINEFIEHTILRHAEFNVKEVESQTTLVTLQKTTIERRSIMSTISTHSYSVAHFLLVCDSVCASPQFRLDDRNVYSVHIDAVCERRAATCQLP